MSYKLSVLDNIIKEADSDNKIDMLIGKISEASKDERKKISYEIAELIDGFDENIIAKYAQAEIDCEGIDSVVYDLKKMISEVLIDTIAIDINVNIGVVPVPENKEKK